MIANPNAATNSVSAARNSVDAAGLAGWLSVPVDVIGGVATGCDGTGVTVGVLGLGTGVVLGLAVGHELCSATSGAVLAHGLGVGVTTGDGLGVGVTTGDGLGVGLGDGLGVGHAPTTTL